MPGLRENISRLRDILNQEAYRLGGRWDHLILVGVGQGATLAVQTILSLAVPPISATTSSASDHRPARIGALVAISGMTPFTNRTLEETRRILGLQVPAGYEDILSNTPILIEHCVDDTVLSINDGQTLRDTLINFGMQVTWKEYASGGHWLNNPDGTADLITFLQETVPRSPQDANLEPEITRIWNMDIDKAIEEGRIIKVDRRQPVSSLSTETDSGAYPDASEAGT